MLKQYRNLLKVLAVGLIASWSFNPTLAFAEPVTDYATAIPDNGLRACINDRIGIDAAAEPSADELAAVTDLSCGNRGITSIAGLANLPNLSKIFLTHNQITDVAPLLEAPKLFSVGLGNNQISNVAPLAQLPELRNLGLEGNAVSDLSPLAAKLAAGMTLTSHAQKVTGIPAHVGTPASVPGVIGKLGSIVHATAPDGVSVSNGMATYSSSGEIEWSFRDPDHFGYNGTITISVSPAVEGVNLPDANLKACINQALGQDAQIMPTSEQLRSLTSLTCTNRGIADLTGMAELTNLTSFSAATNSIKDLSPLAGLPLSVLQLNGNLVASLAPLNGVKTLTSLSVDNNNLATLAGLDSLPQLQRLSVNMRGTSELNRLISLAGVERLTALTYLAANNAQISDLTPLADHPTLTEVRLMGNKVTDIAPLSSAVNLKVIALDNNQITDIAPLAGLSKVTTLQVPGNRLADLSPLKGKTYTIKAARQVIAGAEATAEEAVPTPSVIDRSGARVRFTQPANVAVADGLVTYPAAGEYVWKFEANDASYPYAQFSGEVSVHVVAKPAPTVGLEFADPALQTCVAGHLGLGSDDPIKEDAAAGISELTCVNKGINDLGGIEQLTGLAKLTLSRNAVSDLAPLVGLPLRELMLNGNDVVDVAPLASVTSLQRLYLDSNKVESIAVLAPLTDLTDLTVSQGKVDRPALGSLHGVETMSKLTRLVANNAKINDLGPIVSLTNLDRLYLNNNQISDITPLAGLAKLTNVGLSRNQISDVRPLAGLTGLTNLDLATNRILDLSPLKALPLGEFGLKARWQTVTADQVPAGLAVSVPLPRTIDGKTLEVTSEPAVEVHHGRVIYPNEGSYVWTFADAHNTFSGSITQPVLPAQADAAELPDAGLRACLSEAALVPTGAVLTTTALAKVLDADCADRGIESLTGLDGATALQQLSLAGNPLTDLAELGQLSALASLDLSRTGLADATPLAELTGLQALKVNGNRLADLSPLGALSLRDLEAFDQVVTLPDVEGGREIAVPVAISISGDRLVVNPPEGVQLDDGKVKYSKAGQYTWTFGASQPRALAREVVAAAVPADAFSGSFVQNVTSDVVDTAVHDGAQECLASGNVWVLVERDTGAQFGACATRFATGLEALASAGFTAEGGGFITAIDGYPALASSDFYWSYWHASQTESDWQWEYSMAGASESAPQPGTVEGWRYVAFIPGEMAAAPNWLPASGPDPQPEPQPEPQPRPQPDGDPGTQPQPLPQPEAQPQQGTQPEPVTRPGAQPVGDSTTGASVPGRPLPATGVEGVTGAAGLLLLCLSVSVAGHASSRRSRLS